MKVAITVQSIQHPNYSEQGHYLNVKWQQFAEKVGIILVPVSSIALLNTLISKNYIEGVILSGGGNLSKNFPNKNLTMKLNEKVDLDREEIESKLIDFSINSNIPLIGVCRGMQALSLYHGSKLLGVEGHVNSRHILEYYCPILKRKIKRNINSYHDYAIKDEFVPEAFLPNASHDGSVEQMMHENLKILGIMWHPEREDEFSLLDIELFKKFFGIIR